MIYVAFVVSLTVYIQCVHRLMESRRGDGSASCLVSVSGSSVHAEDLFMRGFARVQGLCEGDTLFSGFFHPGAVRLVYCIFWLCEHEKDIDNGAETSEIFRPAWGSVLS
jgi:hypothetical protein